MATRTATTRRSREPTRKKEPTRRKARSSSRTAKTTCNTERTRHGIASRHRSTPSMMALTRAIARGVRNASTIVRRWADCEAGSPSTRSMRCGRTRSPASSGSWVFTSSPSCSWGGATCSSWTTCRTTPTRWGSCSRRSSCSRTCSGAVGPTSSSSRRTTITPGTRTSSSACSITGSRSTALSLTSTRWRNFRKARKPTVSAA
mmetsp:Transcript_11137/g.21893  ORF Transcript_11137/g.21893 Transcript_11137/m.21893 type:complete len:203 (+) Transcript_11137:446-1054(+)